MTAAALNSTSTSSPAVAPTKIALHGATGRMGRTIARICLENPAFELVGAAARSDDPAQGHDMGILCGLPNSGVAVGPDVSAALLGADVAIDFSLAPAVEGFAAAAVAQGVAIVSGTTGLDERQLAVLERASKKVPVLWARNMSLGVQVLAELVAEAVRKLGPGYDVEVVEVHHHHKVDCPSGTALRLADAARLARPELEDVCSRVGQVGPRKANELGVFGLRGGDVIGDHTVHLMGLGERLELTHRATSREVFAHGAVRAAAWIKGKPPGMYTIADVVR
jgi:4-hydroxy-tetrahydrodipicolinate reductase